MDRLRRKGDIRRVFREGRRVQSSGLVLQCRRRGPDEGIPEGTRLTVVAARRFPSAVARNRARRTIREASRVALGESREPWDVVIVVRPETAERPYRERLALIGELLGRSGVMPASTATT